MTIRLKRSLLTGGAAVTAVTLVAAYVLATAGPATAKPFATLNLLQGSVAVQAGGASAHQGADGETLRRGDTVRTGEGRAAIEYFDGSVTRLDRGTVFTITELASSPQDERIAGRQASGSTFSRVVELTGSDSRFDVETPSAIASVRGTVFFTDADSGLIGVVKGEVLVSGDRGVARVIAGRGVTVTESGEIGTPFILTPEMLDSDWLFYNLCVLDHVLAACHRVPPRVVEPEAPEPTALPPAVVTTTEEAAAPQQEPKQQQQDEQTPPPTDTQPPVEVQPPPAPAPPPQPPPPPDHPGNPPCDNPGQGTPCDGPGNPGAPPGHAGTQPAQTKNG